MKFSYFNESQNRFGFASIGRGFTGLLGTFAPRISTYVGSKMLLKPRGKRHYDFQQIQVHKEMKLLTSMGTAHINLFGSGKKLVVLTHGWADNSRSFQQIILSLTQQGYLVAALDHIGHGKSTGDKAHLLSFIETLELLLEHFHDERVAVEAIIGHSMGAYATLNLPHHLLENKKLILISSPVHFFNAMFEKIERFGISRKLTQRLLESISQKYGKQWHQLQLEHHVDKLDFDVTFIHDRDDRHAPFSEIETFLQQDKAKLITTEGLGHSRILVDTNVITNISQVLAA